MIVKSFVRIRYKVNLGKHWGLSPDMFNVTNLAFIGLDIRVDDHVSLESLFLHKTLEAHVALVGPYVGVDEDVALHVGQQGELTATDTTLVLLHPLKKKRM